MTPAAGDRFTLRLAVTDDAGNVWSSTETDLLNEVAHPPDWEADERHAALCAGVAAAMR
jgi:hypothetical protein